MLRALHLGIAIVIAAGIVACDGSTPAAPGSGPDGGIIPPPTGGSGGTGGMGSGGIGGAGGAGGLGGVGGIGGAGGLDGIGGFGGAGDLGACSNPTDFAALASLEPESNARSEAAFFATSQPCVGTPNLATFASCVAGELQTLLPTLSPECAQCYGDLASCSRLGGCNLSCAPNSCLQPTPCSCGVVCLLCPGYSECENALDACTGRTPPECGET